MKKLSIFFEKQFASKDQAEYVMLTSIPHYVQGGLIATSIISFFEVLMLLRIFFFGLGSPERNLQYGICYVALLVASLTLITLVLCWKKDIVKHRKHLYILQNIYCLFITIWATVITLLDGHYHQYYDVAVYMTILLITPLIVFVNPVIIILIQVISDFVIACAIFKSGYIGGLINFLVYAILSILACYVFQKTKQILYIKQALLKEQAIKDPLTGIYNRQILRENGQKVWDECLKEQQPISLIMADIDLFKNINDCYGHLSGDKCIKKVADAFAQACNDSKFSCYRYGGEEFLMLLENTTNEEAINKVNEINSNISKLFENDEDGLNVTLSYGIYTNTPSGEMNLEKYLSKADDLLYQSKSKGRNCFTTSN